MKFTTALVLAICLSGCAASKQLAGSMKSKLTELQEKNQAKNAPPKAAEPYLGELTINNTFAEDVCSVEIQMSDSYAHLNQKVAAGGSMTHTLTSPVKQIQVFGCDESYLASGDYSDSTPMSTSVVRLGGESEDGVTVLSLNKKSFEEIIAMVGSINQLAQSGAPNDKALAKKFHTAFEQYREVKFSDREDPAMLTKVAYKEWVVLKNRHTGIPVSRRHYGWVGRKLKNGECLLQVHTFVQQHTGSGFSDSATHEGMLRNTGYDRSCTIVDWFSKKPGVYQL